METGEQIANTLTGALCAFGAVWSQLSDRPLVADEVVDSGWPLLRGPVPERGDPHRRHVLALRQTAVTAIDCWRVLEEEARADWLEQAEDVDAQLLGALLTVYAA
jgi:hypothetical protein